MELYNIWRYNKKKLILFIILTFLFANFNMSVSAIDNNSLANLYIQSIDIPLLASTQVVTPPSMTTFSSSARTKRVIDETTVLNRAAVKNLKVPKADGKLTFNNDTVEIDASNASEGYIMIKYNSNNSDVLKVVIIKNMNTELEYRYYMITLNEFVAFPLTDGNGTYSVQVHEHIVGTRYVLKGSAKFNATITDTQSQYLYPNYFADYNGDTKCVKIAEYLCEGLTSDLKKVEEIYHYVIDNITYDYDLAANLPQVYVPNLDRIITDKNGICGDYSSLMTAMLRSVGIPTKLVHGYTSNIYHAWISVYIKDVGWIDSIIKFDGVSWKLMDPTFAASSSSSNAVMEYIGNGKNYSVRYTY